MNTLVAFDKFKGSLSAAEACEIASAAVRATMPSAMLESAPLTDGGEGFVELLTKAAGGELITSDVAGPLGESTSAHWGLAPISNLPEQARNLLRMPAEGQIAIVEMAQASGLQLLKENERNPWRTTTRGTGQLLRLAAERKPAAILLGIGGSATHDLGLGTLHALGLQADFDGDRPTDFAPQNWDRVVRFRGSLDISLPPIYIASDVDNPLLGERGAAKVYGHQKGLRAEDCPRLEELTRKISHLLCEHFQSDPRILAERGSGAAGGIGTGLRIACQARIVSGFALVRAWTDLDRKIAEADLILTGEGCFDASSLEGKGPGVLVRKATEAGKRCLVLAGRLDLSEELINECASCSFIEISPRDWPNARVLAEAPDLLRKGIERAVEKVL